MRLLILLLADFQTKILRLILCVVIILLTHAGYFKSNQEQRVRQHTNKTVFVGETVILHCNKTIFDDDFTWKMNNSVIFRQISDINMTTTNFSSNRTHIDPAAPRELTIHQIQASDAGNYSCYPAAERWTLTVTENQIRPDSLKQIPLFIIIIIIIISCCGVITICLIISIGIHRKLKQMKMDSDLCETDQEGIISDCDKHTITVCVYSLHTVS